MRGFTRPEEIGPELVSRFGPFYALPSWISVANGWVDDDRFVELQEYQNNWKAEAAVYLMARYPWSLYFTEMHCTDHAAHRYLWKLDPTLIGKTSNKFFYPRGMVGIKELTPAAAKKWMAEIYMSVDRAVGNLLTAADN